MNKPEYVHWEPVHLTRSMSPRAEREFNNVPLMTREETTEELVRNSQKSIRVETLIPLYLRYQSDLKFKELMITDVSSINVNTN